MKNSMKISASIMAMLFVITGFCFGQEKATKKQEKVIKVTGVSTTTKDEAIEVVGFPLEQNKDRIELKRNRVLNFKNASKKSEVIINVTSDQNWLDLRIESNFNTGSVLVEIIDPDGVKIGTYTVKTDEPVELGENTTTTEYVNAKFGKDFRYPKKGEWIVRALPTSATGWIALDFTQAYYPGLNR